MGNRAIGGDDYVVSAELFYEFVSLGSVIANNGNVFGVFADL